MKSTPFEAVFDVSLYTDDVLVEKFNKTIKVRALTTEEGMSMAKSMLYEELVHRTPEVPYENYVVDLKSFTEDTLGDAKSQYLALSTKFFLTTGLELLFTSLVVRHVFIALLFTAMALYFDKDKLTIVLYITTIVSGVVIIARYKPVLSKVSYAWIHTIVLLTSLIQALIFWV